MSQTLFTHDAELTLRAACVLVNSDRINGEQLGDQDALDGYLGAYGWTGRRDRDRSELAAVHRLRRRLGRIWAIAEDEDQTVAEVNALLGDTRAAPWLTRHPEMPEWHLHLASTDDPLAQRMGAEMAMALADLIREAGLKPEVAEIIWKPNAEAVLTGDDAVKMQKLLDALESLDDVQEVYSTAVIDE